MFNSSDYLSWFDLSYFSFFFFSNINIDAHFPQSNSYFLFGYYIILYYAFTVLNIKKL